MTTSGESASPNAALSLTRAGWMRVSEEILAGLGHDLSNRAASLEGMSLLLDAGRSEALEQLSPEVRRLEGSVAALRALLGDVEAEPEPLLVSDVMNRVQELHRMRKDLAAVDVAYTVAEGLPPVVANPTCLARILLVLIDGIASATLGRDREEVAVDVAASPVEVRVSIGCTTRAGPWLELGTTAALRELIAPWEWTLVEDPGSVLLSLPSLTRGSAREG